MILRAEVLTFFQNALILYAVPTMVMAADSSTAFVLVKAWLPFVVLFGLLVFFMKKSGATSQKMYLERAHQHMEKIEGQMQRTNELLEKISVSLEKK